MDGNLFKNILFISFLRKHLLKVPYISLVNLVANKEVVTELVADQMNEENIKRELAMILPDGSKRQVMLDEYEEMNRILGGEGASDRAAKAMIDILNSKQHGI